MHTKTVANVVGWLLVAVFMLPTLVVGAEESDSALEVSFFSSPKVGGGNLSQGFVRYSWSETFSSRIGFSYATETYNAEFEDEDIDESLVLVTNDLYRLDLVPLELTRGKSRFGFGLNTTVESINQYGFYATNASSSFGEDVIAFEEDRFRLFLSPRVGWGYSGGGDLLQVTSNIWVAPLFVVVSEETFFYRSGADREAVTEVNDGVGIGFPEIELDVTFLIARRLQLELAVTYRYFLMEEYQFSFDSDGEDFGLLETEYDTTRLLAVASIPITLPNESRFRVGAGVLMYLERNLTEGTQQLQPGFTVLFGVEP